MYQERKKILNNFNVNPTLLCDRKTATTKGFFRETDE